MLTGPEIERYARHIVLHDVGGPGQARLKAARVLAIGAGGLGAPLLQYLAAAGVGTLGIVDDDSVALSNLQRQVLHGTPDVGRPKVESAADAIIRLNPPVTVETFPTRLDAGNARALVRGWDVVADGSDNFATRYAVSDACFHEAVPLVTAAVGSFDASLTTLRPHERDAAGAPNPTYRCLFPQAPAAGMVPTCAEVGVLGALTRRRRPVRQVRQHRVEVGEVARDARRAGVGQRGGFVVAPGDADRAHAGRHRHGDVVGRVANQHRGTGRHARLGQGGAQHGWIGLGGVVVGGLHRREDAVPVLRRQEAIHPLARLSRREAEHDAGPAKECGDRGGGTGIERLAIAGLLAQREPGGLVTLDQSRDRSLLADQHREGLGERQAHHRERPLARRHWEADRGEGPALRLDDVMLAVDERAVDIEDHEAKRVGQNGRVAKLKERPRGPGAPCCRRRADQRGGGGALPPLSAISCVMFCTTTRRFCSDGPCVFTFRFCWP